MEIKPRLRTIVSVGSSFPLEEINYDKKELTQIDFWYSDRFPKGPNHGVLGYHSVNEQIKVINNIKGRPDKKKVPTFVKGIYRGGTGGIFCEESTDLLPIDVDVKNKDGKKENTHLFDKNLNTVVFEYLKTICVFVARSNSGYGMFGYVRVKDLGRLLQPQKTAHKLIGDEVTKRLSRMVLEATGIVVDFDRAQNAFRIPRLTAVQKTPVVVNRKPALFSFDLSYEEMRSEAGVPQYKIIGHRGYKGSIMSQFNEANMIEDVLVACGFTQTSGTRYKHHLSSSKDTGSTNPDNTFYSHSSSYGVRIYSPFDIAFRASDLNYRDFMSGLSYRTIALETSIVDAAVEKLNAGGHGSVEIFEACDPLREGLSVEAKYEFIDRLSACLLTRVYVMDYLQIPDLVIRYDFSMEIEGYLGEDLENLLPTIEEHPKVLISAGTGLGKTRAFIDHFKKQVDKRTLFLVPLQTIVDQCSADYGVPGITGNSSLEVHSMAVSANVVVCTYEAGIKFMQTNAWDNIVLDECHQIIVSMSYKLPTLSELSRLLEDTTARVIALTGTASNILRRLGFVTINITKVGERPMKVVERFSNKGGHFTAVNHIASNKDKKIMVRLNSVNDLESIKAELIEKHGLKDEEVLVLYSSKAMKHSKAYQRLVNEGMFSDTVRVVLSTSLIDEGLSINQTDFDQVVFIEANNYYPRPEAIKQYFARLRKPKDSVEYYFYRKYTVNGATTYFNEDAQFNLKKAALEEREVVDRHTYRDIYNDDSLYYSDGRVNKASLGYAVSQEALANYTPYMFDRYLMNYGIEIVRDEKFKMEYIDNTLKKEWNRSVSQMDRDLWVNYNSSVLSTLKHESEDSDIRISLADTNLDWHQGCIDAIRDRMPVFERTYTNAVLLTELGVSDPNQYLVEEKRLSSVKKVNNAIFGLSSKAVIESPKTKADLQAKKKLLDAIDRLKKMGTFSGKDMEKAFIDKAVVKKPSVEAMKILLREYVNLEYNKRTKMYVIN